MHRLFSKKYHHDPNTGHLLHVFPFVFDEPNNKYPAFPFISLQVKHQLTLPSSFQDTDHAAFCSSPSPHNRELSELVTAGHLSQLPGWAADKPKHSSRNTHDLLSTYQLILHTKVSHIKSNHSGHETKQVQNLVATCYHCACNLYTGFHNTQSLPPP